MEMNYTPIPPYGAARNEPAPDLRNEVFRLFRFARRQAPLVLLCTVLAGLLALFLLENAVPTYRSQVRLLLSQTMPAVVRGEAQGDTLRDVDEYIATQIALIESRSIAARVMDDLSLTERLDELGGDGGVLAFLRSLAGRLAALVAPDTGGTVGAVQDEEARVIGFLQSNLITFRVARSYVIEIGFDSADPDLSREIADAYGRAFLTDQFEGRLEGLNRIGGWLEGRIEEIGRQSLEASKAVERFRAENDLVVADGRLVADQQLEGLNLQLINARAAASAAQSQVEVYAAAIEQGDVETLISLRRAREGTTGEESGLASDYLLAAERERAVAARWGEDNEQRRAIAAERDRLAGLLRADAQRTLEGYRSELAQARSGLAAVTANFRAATQASETASSTLVSLRDLEQRAQSYQSLYQNYLARYQETVQQQSLPVDTARIITAAVAAEEPLFPNYKIAMALALVLGAGAGACAGIAREFFDSSLRTRADIEANGLAFLGYVPVGAGGETTSGERRWVRMLPAAGRLRKKRGASAEGVFAGSLQRVLLSAEPARAEPLVLAVTSLDEDQGERRCFIAKSLARKLVALGYDVLLIVADDPGTPRDEAVERPKAGRTANPTVVHARDSLVLGQNPSGSAVSALGPDVSGLKGRFDRIVIVGAPLSQPLHLAALVPTADRFVVLARWGSTARRPLSETIRLIPGLKGKCMGALLDETPLKAVARYDSDIG